jgi:hypothetical protein
MTRRGSAQKVGPPETDEQVDRVYRLTKQGRQDFCFKASTVFRSHTSNMRPQPPQTISHLSGVRVRLCFNLARHSGQRKSWFWAWFPFGVVFITSSDFNQGHVMTPSSWSWFKRRSIGMTWH